jgi:cold shock CspA family protein/ribosome-associated translation inhibitor RaiA
MQMPLEISYRDVDRTDALDDFIRQNVDKLEEVCDYLVGCRVAVERPHAHPQTGSGWRVRIDITVPPGHEVVVVRNPSEGTIRDDVYNVVQSAFSATRRSLKRLVEQQQEEVKSHPAQQVSAVVHRLFPDGYGYLRTADGDREIYFHRNALVDIEWQELKIGMGASFNEVEDDNGVRATTVRIVDRRGRAVGENQNPMTPA